MSKCKQKDFHYYPVFLQEYFTYTKNLVYVYPVAHLRTGKVKVFDSNNIERIGKITNYNRPEVEKAHFNPIDDDLSSKVRNIVERCIVQDRTDEVVNDPLVNQTISELIAYLSLNHPFTRKKWLDVVESVRFHCDRCSQFSVSVKDLSIKSMDKLYLETKSILIECLEKAYRQAVLRTDKDAFITTDYPVVFYTPDIEHGTYRDKQSDSKSFLEPNIPFSWELPERGLCSRHGGETILHNVKNNFTFPHYIYLPITPKLAFLYIRDDIEDTIFPIGKFDTEVSNNISFFNKINLLTAYQKGISNSEELLINTIKSTINDPAFQNLF